MIIACHACLSILSALIVAIGLSFVLFKTVFCCVIRKIGRGFSKVFTYLLKGITG